VFSLLVFIALPSCIHLVALRITKLSCQTPHRHYSITCIRLIISPRRTILYAPLIPPTRTVQQKPSVSDFPNLGRTSHCRLDSYDLLMLMLMPASDIVLFPHHLASTVTATCWLDQDWTPSNERTDAVSYRHVACPQPPFLGVSYLYHFCCHHHLFDCDCGHTAEPVQPVPVHPR